MRCSYQNKRFDWAAFVCICLQVLFSDPKFLFWTMDRKIDCNWHNLLFPLDRPGMLKHWSALIWKKIDVVEVSLWWRGRKNHSGKNIMIPLQMFQESFFDFLAYTCSFWQVTLKYQKGCFGSKIWVWSLLSKHFANNCNWSRTIADSSFFLSGKLGVDLDAIDVTRGLVALWHKRFFCSSNKKQGY